MMKVDDKLIAIERQITDKVKSRLKTSKGNIFEKKLAELEDRFNEKLKSHVTHEVVDEALQKYDAKAMLYVEKIKRAIKEDMKTEIAVETDDVKSGIERKIDDKLCSVTNEYEIVNLVRTLASEE